MAMERASRIARKCSKTRASVARARAGAGVTRNRSCAKPALRDRHHDACVAARLWRWLARQQGAISRALIKNLRGGTMASLSRRRFIARAALTAPALVLTG